MKPRGQSLALPTSVRRITLAPWRHDSCSSVGLPRLLPSWSCKGSLVGTYLLFVWSSAWLLVPLSSGCPVSSVFRYTHRYEPMKKGEYSYFISLIEQCFKPMDILVYMSKTALSLPLFFFCRHQEYFSVRWVDWMSYMEMGGGPYVRPWPFLSGNWIELCTPRAGRSSLCVGSRGIYKTEISCFILQDLYQPQDVSFTQEFYYLPSFLLPSLPLSSPFFSLLLIKPYWVA